MGQALYRKYRSMSLDMVVGQEHITDTLRRAIKSGKISHAYLFTGPRGVGKTSIARILAHELNEVAYSGEDNHLDIIEIDAASNGGVDEVRDLRDKVYIAPTNGKYKVYIIDEVHMMTTSAFNALLKTLEEPPAHAIFILATTEAHKLPATIISRTQRFTFKPIAQDKMIAHLRSIATSEKIDITDDALVLIAEHSEGSFRDAIQMLDQASSGAKKIDKNIVEILIGLPSAGIIAELITSIQNHQITVLTELLTRLRSEGYQASAIAKQLGQTLRAQLITNQPLLAPAQTLGLLSRLLDVPASPQAEQLLEIVLLEAALDGAVGATPDAPRAVKVHQPSSAPTPAAAASPARPTSVTAENEDESAPASSAVIDTNAWQALLESLKKEYNTLYGIVRMAHPEFTPGHVTLTFGFVFHQKRANDPKNKKILTSTLETITGERLKIECKYDKNATPLGPGTTATEPVNSSPALGAVGAIFGGGEILQ